MRFLNQKYGYTKGYFTGLPTGVESAFRFVNGKIYFFKEDLVYAYNEFLNTSENGGGEKSALSILGIKCIDVNLVSKLIDLLRCYV